MAFSRLTACIFALENCEYERWQVPGPRVTAHPFANMFGTIVSMVENAPELCVPVGWRFRDFQETLDQRVTSNLLLDFGAQR